MSRGSIFMNVSVNEFLVWFLRGTVVEACALLSATLVLFVQWYHLFTRVAP